MPNQITHIAVAVKVFDETFAKFNKRDFFVGMIFADIRYLGVVYRDKTHFNNVTLDLVLKAKTSFEAGLLFHSLVDRTFNDNVVNTLPKLDSLNDITGAAKLLADELLYNKVNNWSEIISYFDNIILDELNFGVDKKSVLVWHEAIKNVFAEAPTDINRSEFMIKLNFSEDQINYANKLLSEIRNNKDLSEVLLNFYTNFTL